MEVSPLQQFLSSRPPRSNTYRPGGFTLFNGLIETKFYEEGGDNWVQADIKIDPSRKEQVGGAPLHMHPNQSETFHVLKGRMNAVMSGKKISLTAGDPEYTSPAGEWHSFQPDENFGDFTVRIKVDPEGSPGFDEAFFRNFQSYLHDCEQHKTNPSIFQIVVFFNSADVLIGLPLPLAAIKGLHVLFGWIGTELLGYKASYPEYSETKKII